MKKISVIIPAHNEEKYIEKTLLSIKRNQTPLELIIICDSCSDKTSEISAKYTENVFSVNFKNISKTRNFGVSKSLGDVLVFIDADTIISENYLEEIFKVIDICDYGCAKWVSESRTFLGKYIAWVSNNYSKKNIGGNFFIRKEVFEKIEGFNENMLQGEDTDIGDRLKNNEFKHCFLKNCFIIPSERRYKEKGYIKLIIRSGVMAFLYKIFRSYYNKIALK
jgi:glycosyltransferase involved in cell wall biosynthesis